MWHLFCQHAPKRKVAQAAFSFCTLHYSLFTLHFSLISPTRLFQRRDKREERREKREKKMYLFAIAKSILIDRCQSAFSGKGAEMNLCHVIFTANIEKYQKI